MTWCVVKNVSVGERLAFWRREMQLRCSAYPNTKGELDTDESSSDTFPQWRGWRSFIPSLRKYWNVLRPISCTLVLEEISTVSRPMTRACLPGSIHRVDIGLQL